VPGVIGTILVPRLIIFKISSGFIGQVYFLKPTSSHSQGSIKVGRFDVDHLKVSIGTEFNTLDNHPSSIEKFIIRKKGTRGRKTKVRN